MTTLAAPTPGATAASQGSKNPWLDQRPRRQATDPALRLFCFPFAGGGAGVYQPWHGAFGPDVETVGMRPPGRESRLGETAFTRMAPLADAATDALDGLTDRPFALFGHSLGSLMALEVAHRLADRGTPPTLLMVAGRRAPHLPLAQPKLHSSDDATLIAELERLGGTPQELLDDSSLMELMLPLIRADFELFETYVVPEHRPPLPCPILAFGGVRDTDVARAHLEAWRGYGNGDFELHMFPGGHFFLQQADARALRSTVARRLSKLLP